MEGRQYLSDWLEIALLTKKSKQKFLASDRHIIYVDTKVGIAENRRRAAGPAGQDDEQDAPSLCLRTPCGINILSREQSVRFKTRHIVLSREDSRDRQNNSDIILRLEG